MERIDSMASQTSQKDDNTLTYFKLGQRADNIHI